MRYEKDLVSICLPVYNGEHYLDGAIESALSQSHQNLELLIFDDFSSDHSLKIIERYAAQDNRIHYWRTARRQGLFETFNQCMGQARGEYIKPFTQDDILRSTALAKCVAKLEAEPTVALVSVGYEVMDARSNILKGLGKSAEADTFEPNSLILASEVLNQCLFPLHNHIGEISSIMFRAEHQGTGFDTRLHQFADIDYWLRILMRGDYISIAGAYAFVRHHLGSAAVNNTRNMMGASDLIKIGRKFSRVIEACGKSEEIFLDLSIPAYIAQLEELLTDGTIDGERLRKADDLRRRAETNSAHEASASATAAFSALASALAGGDVSCVAFEPRPTETATEMLQDLIDFREFAFHAVRLLTRAAQKPTYTLVQAEPSASSETKQLAKSEDDAKVQAQAAVEKEVAQFSPSGKNGSGVASGYRDMAIQEIEFQTVGATKPTPNYVNNVLTSTAKADQQTNARTPRKRGHVHSEESFSASEN